MANAERGMTGITKYISKLRGINDPEDEEPLVDHCKEAEIVPDTQEIVEDSNATSKPKVDFRGRMEDKLKELRQRQTDKEQE